MSSLRPQAIAGVSAGSENVVQTVYPSISASAPGRLIGSAMNLIPIGIGGVKLSYLLFGPFLAPFGLAGYFAEKVMGQKYVLTNRSLSRWAFVGTRLFQRIELEQIAGIAVEQQSGQEFYKAADLVIVTADGNEIMRLPGVPRAEIFRETILKTRKARVEVEASLAHIRARHSA